LVTVPDNAVVGIVVEAVIKEVPLPYTYPVNELAPVPPLEAFKTPDKVTAPLVANAGAKPVDPALNVETPPASVNAFHDPAE
jgi:hypothetical protein